MLEWKSSKIDEKDLIAQNRTGHYRVEWLGPRTFLLKIDAQFVGRYRTQEIAKEEAEKIERQREADGYSIGENRK